MIEEVFQSVTETYSEKENLSSLNRTKESNLRPSDY